MDRIVEWATIKIDRIWSCTNDDQLPPLLLEADEVDSSHARSKPLLLASDDMDSDFGAVERSNTARI